MKFSVILATNTIYDGPERIWKEGGRLIAMIGGNQYISHEEDNVVMIDADGEPRYLLYTASNAIFRIHSINTMQSVLLRKLQEATDLTEGPVYWRKSRLIPLTEVVSGSG